MQKAMIHARGLVVLLSSAPAIAEDEMRGQGRTTECVACHGVSGISDNPMFLHLAGQNAAYLHMQLDNFRDGTRYHPLMTPVAQSLTDQEISDLAEYFSSLRPLAGVRDTSSVGSTG